MRQPASHASETLSRLVQDYAGAFCVTDTGFDTLDLPRTRYAALTDGTREVQCAETASIARGRGRACARACQAGPVRPGSSSSIGEPWERKTGGMVLMLPV